MSVRGQCCGGCFGTSPAYTLLPAASVAQAMINITCRSEPALLRMKNLLGPVLNGWVIAAAVRQPG